MRHRVLLSFLDRHVLSTVRIGLLPKICRLNENQISLCLKKSEIEPDVKVTAVTRGRVRSNTTPLLLFFLEIAFEAN